MGRQKSVIWKHFQKVNSDTASCRYCDKRIKTSGNTSNMRGHLMALHASIFTDTDTTDTENDDDNLSKKRRLQGPLNTTAKRIKLRSATTTSHQTSLNATAGCSSSSSNSPNIGAPAGSSADTTKSNNKENIRESFVNIRSFQEGGLKHSKLTDKILFMICKDSQP